MAVDYFLVRAEHCCWVRRGSTKSEIADIFSKISPSAANTLPKCQYPGANRIWSLAVLSDSVLPLQFLVEED